jgi:3',5'-cyclic AMP phosphodiesterase CpdA
MTRQRWLMILLFLAATRGAAAQEPRAIAPADEHRPGLLPDRVILTWRGDPAKTQAVTWRTDTGVARGVAQIAVAEAWTKSMFNAKEVKARTQLLKSDLSDAHYHTAHFEELTPKTRYVYRVGDGVNWSEWHQFQTAAAGPEPFTFLYFGDAQVDIKQHWSRVLREAFATAPRARFMIHAGDLINQSDSDAEWGEWFAAGGWLHATVPSIPAPGNHEYARFGAKHGELSEHWRVHFALPEHGPPGLEETAYYLDYQGVRVVVLNSNEQLPEQAQWLDRVLANNPNRWTVVTFHHPVYSATTGRDNSRVRGLWQPLFDKYRVDLVLQGHDHTYGRSGLRGFEGPAAGGTVYVVSVSGPQMYNLGAAEWARRKGEETQLFQVIRVDGDKLYYEARTPAGELFDSFHLVKRPGRVNELVETGPPQPPEARGPGFDVRTALILGVVFVVFTGVALNVARKAVRRA